MRGVLGLRGQRMALATEFVPYAATFPAGTYTFIAPASGRFKFTLWGGGSVGGTTGGGSGALVQITRVMRRSETATIVVGAHAGASSVTFADGVVATAGGGVGTGGGTATGGDININGSLGGDGTTNPGSAGGGDAGGDGGGVNGGASGGAGAPGYASYRGGRGATAGTAYASTPGGGGSGDAGGLAHTVPGLGLAIVERV